jgi:hypothetical protein
MDSASSFWTRRQFYSPLCPNAQRLTGYIQLPNNTFANVWPLNQKVFDRIFGIFLIPVFGGYLNRQKFTEPNNITYSYLHIDELHGP